MDSETLGLRERKRRATRRAIELAVLTLANEHGIDGVTIEQVSAAADVSPRTFFNYFSSKEAAIIGEAPEITSVVAIESFVTAGVASDLLDDIAQLLSKSIPDADDVEIVQARRSLLAHHPALFAMRMATMRTFETQLAGIIGRRLALDAPQFAATPEELDNKARLITSVAVGVMRHAWRCWAESEQPSRLDERLADSFQLAGTMLVKSLTESSTKL